MLTYIIKCLFHIGIGTLLFASFQGINIFLNTFFKKKIFFFYPSTLTVYFFCSYFFFMVEKKLLIYFTIFSSFIYLHNQLKIFLSEKKYFKSEFLTIFFIFLSISLILGKIFHGPEENYTAFGLFDMYDYTSLIYQDNLSYFKVINNNIFGYERPIYFSIITFLGNQFVISKYFDPFNFISISLLIFSILSLKSEIINLKINIKNSLTNLLLIIFTIFSLPYPLYLFESPIILIALPILPLITISILNLRNLKTYDYFFIAFSILISKLAFYSFFFLSIICDFFFKKKNIVKKISISVIVLIFFNQVFPFETMQKIFFTFNMTNFEFLNLKLNFQSIHLITKLIIVVLLLFFIKKKFLIFYFLPSVFLHVFFPSSSPGQIFYILLLVLLTNAVDSNKLFKTFQFNKYLVHLIFSYGIFFIGLGFFFKIDFYLYLLYLIIFLFIFNIFNLKTYKIINLFLIILILLSLNNYNFRQDGVLTLAQKEIYLEIKKITHKKDTLIFSDLHLTIENLSPPWGLYSSISERQFYISSFYIDYRNVFSEKKRNEMYKINKDIISHNMHPKNFFNDSINTSFYILTKSNGPHNENADVIFKNMNFTILKFK